MPAIRAARHLERERLKALGCEPGMQTEFHVCSQLRFVIFETERHDHLFIAELVGQV